MSLNPSLPADAPPPQETTPNETIFQKNNLDILRGFALLGLLVVSIWEFGGFTTNEQTYYHTGTHGGNFQLMQWVSLLFDGKMLSLLALVFGAGIILYLQKKDHPVSLIPADAHIRRMMWLMVFGVVNAFLLLWPGDILFSLGVVGILLFAFSRMKSKGLIITALVCILIYCGKQYWYYADDKKDYGKYKAVLKVEKKFKEDSTARAKKDSIDRTKDSVLFKDTLAKNKLMDSLAKKNDTLTKKQAEDKGKWEGRVKQLKYDSSNTAMENKIMQTGSWGKIWDHLVGRAQNKESFWLYRIGVWDLGAMMLLGMALLHLGFFNAGYSRSRYLVIGLIALAIGLALSCYRLHNNGARLEDYTKFIDKKTFPYNQFFPIEKAAMALGYASLLMLLFRVRLFKGIGRALAATGRLWLTNYIMQAVLCTFFFYGYGFGYFGRLNQWELYFMVAEIALVQMVFSVFWLRYYKNGPLEWLWRCLIYRKWLPNKKQQPAT